MKIISKDFVVQRTKASRDVAKELAKAPLNYVWQHKDQTEWDDDITELDQLESAEIQARTQWRNAAELWQADLDQIQEITRDVAGFGLVKFRDDAVKRASLESLRTNGRSRPTLEKQGKAARDAWQLADPAWVIKKKKGTVTTETSLAQFSSLIASAEARENTHGAKEKAWKHAAATFNTRLRALNRDCVHWYADVTRFFAADSAPGEMIRSSVPTTSRSEEPVGQAVISNLMAAEDVIHFDCAAPHATRFTYLHRAPDSAAFVVVVTDSPEPHLTLHHQAPGLHLFKAIGRNSSGEGPESVPVSVTVAQSQAA